MNATITAPALSSGTTVEIDTTAQLTESGATAQTTELSEAAAQPAQPAPEAPFADTRETRTFAITSFVLGIASIVSGWTFVAPIIGLVFGVLALRRRTEERTLALWGVWLNGAMLVLTALAMLVAVIALGFGLIALPVLAA